MPISESDLAERLLSLAGKKYRVDRDDFLLHPGDWDEDFASELAPGVGITEGLTERHWEIILFIRRYWAETGACPTVFQTCRMLGLHPAGFHFLFPSGYQAGACKLAGVSYRARPTEDGGEEAPGDLSRKSYRIDIWGFLLDPDEWDDRFAVLKATEMKIPGGLTIRHWAVLRMLREEYYRTWRVPTCFEVCQALNMDLEEMEELFPDGYTRSAVKLAGLHIIERDEA
jgi:tRNA 2-thiouridine synthesizing protein E